MKRYVTPEMKIRKISLEDIIVTSQTGEGGVGTGGGDADNEGTSLGDANGTGGTAGTTAAPGGKDVYREFGG